jgi:hypothetical protein
LSFKKLQLKLKIFQVLIYISWSKSLLFLLYQTADLKFRQAT